MEMFWSTSGDIVKSLPLLFPFHKYLGPGNDIDLGTPFDFDDFIAFQHDLDYSERNTNSIREADKHAIFDFFSAFLDSGSTHALAGWVSLSIKSYLEELFGTVFYPRMAPVKPTHAGHKRYADRLGDISRAYTKHKNEGGKIAWTDFIKQYYATSTQAPSEGLDDRQETQIQEPLAGPSHAQDTMSHRPTTTPALPGVGESPPLSDIMELDIPHGQGQGAVSGNVPNAGSTNVQSKHLHIPRSIGLRKVTLHFVKSCIFYTYGYAFNSIIKERHTVQNKVTVDVGDKVYTTTPLGMLPNDAVFFYMTPNEYENVENMNGTTRILKCSVTVVPQGLRTAFDVGTTLRGTETSEHCAIGMASVGLNQKMYIKGTTYTADAAYPMMPTGVSDVDIDVIINKYYGDNTFTTMPMALGVPRHADMYGTLLLNSVRLVNSYQNHYGGVPLLDKYIDRFNFVPFVGEEMIKWNYYPTNGFLHTRVHDIPYLATQQDTVCSMNTNSHMPTKVVVKMKKDGIATCYASFNGDAFGTKNDAIAYKMSIDGSKIFAPYHDFGSNMKKVVPNIYLGIMPTPELNPSLDTKQFQNTAAYWSVKCAMTVEVDMESLYPLTAANHCTNPKQDVIHYNNIEPIGMETYGN